SAARASATTPMSNWSLQNPMFRKLIEKTLGVDARRPIPKFKRPTFTRWFRTHKNSGAGVPACGVSHKVALFIDVYANYNAPELGRAIVERLERAGCEIVLPEQRSSGYPYIAYGDLDRARNAARYNVERLAPYARDGYTIVSPEPTAVYSLRQSYVKLLDHSEDSEIVAANSRELFDFLLEVEPEQPNETLPAERFGFHVSCHQRPLGSGEHAIEWLRRRGADIHLVETGTCCGMGGTFGLKAGPLGRDLSLAVGESLFAAFREAEVDAAVTESSVCKIQLTDGLDIPIYHPLELLTLAQ
ncbi:MAG: heterodisulfide reductase-related iron-sulfur binding cluster, partial [Candidatus Hydrogenedentales bacterium]